MISAARIQKLGSYVLGDRIGLGGMAEVFAADCPRHGRVALKRILPGLAEDTDFVDMFWDEARITSTLNHRNVVRVLDYGRIDRQLYMALEYVEGPTLARVLRKAARSSESIHASIIVSMATELLRALEYVHLAQDELGVPLDIVHRDVSPGNVMLTNNGCVKLGDFGIVSSQAVARRTQPGELKGKIGYMSPEQALGEEVTCQSDLFSVGIIMAEFLTLRPLFLGKNEMQTLSRTVAVDLETWHKHNRKISAPLKKIVEKALSLELSSRYATAAEMKTDLLKLAEAEQWSLSPHAMAVRLRALELLPTEQNASGERPVVKPPASSTIDKRQRETEPETSPRIYQPEALRSKSLLGLSEKPLWQVEFKEVSLPLRMFAALRRVNNGVVTLATESGVDTQAEELALDVRGGRIAAAHDSSGISPLGHMLNTASIVESHQLAQAIGESRRAGMRLGDFLVLQGRLRESTLSRLLMEQAQLRLDRWMRAPGGRLSVHVHAGVAGSFDGVPDSVVELVRSMRRTKTQAALERALSPVRDAILLPSYISSKTALPLTEPEIRVLETTTEGGVFEGLSLRAVVLNVVRERMAQRTEALFALFVGLSAGVIQAPGFGR